MQKGRILLVLGTMKHVVTDSAEAFRMTNLSFQRESPVPMKKLPKTWLHHSILDGVLVGPNYLLG